MWVTAVLAVIALATGLQAEELDKRQASSSTFLRRVFHGSFVLDKTFYIDGGEYSWRNGTNPAQDILTQTLVISLTESFDTTSSSNTINPAVIDKGDCPNFNEVRFWYDQNSTRAYAYGGEYSQLHQWIGPGTVPQNDLWNFVPLNPGPGGSWQKVDTTSNGGWQRIVRSSGGAATSGGGSEYSLGGYFNSWTDRSESGLGGAYKPAPGMQICNLTENSCTTDSAKGYSTNGTFEFGGLIHIPNWGTHGLVVVIGGQTSPTLDNFIDGQKYQDMRNISIFDPTEQNWYFQTSTGDIPTPRDRFCVVGASEGEGMNGTFQIFMYGGQYGSGPFGSNNQFVSDEVYVLSLPTFQWSKANYTPADNRILHTCHALGRQMLSIGGLDPSASSFEDAIKDSDNFTQGIKVFDMTEMQWTNKWDANVPEYQTPAAIKNTAMDGPASWNMPELEAIFNGTANSRAPGSPAEAKSKKTNTGAIVGGVVGGLVGFALVGMLAFYFLYWKNRKPPAATGERSVDVVELAEAGHGITEVESPPVEMPTKQGRAWELPTKDYSTELP